MKQLPAIAVPQQRPASASAQSSVTLFGVIDAKSFVKQRCRQRQVRGHSGNEQRIGFAASKTGRRGFTPASGWRASLQRHRLEVLRKRQFRDCRFNDALRSADQRHAGEVRLGRDNTRF